MDNSTDIQNLINQLYRVQNGQAIVPLYQLSPVPTDPRVLPAGNVQLLGTQQANGSTSVALGFTKPPDPNISHFEVWVQRSAYTGENPYQVASVTDSPATFTVSADQNTVVIAFIRTVRKDGLATDLQASPTVTFNVSSAITSVPASAITAGTISALVTLTAPTLVITSGTITVNIDGTNFVKVTNTATNATTTMDYSHFHASKTNNSQFCNLDASGISGADPTGLITYTLSHNLFQLQGLPSANPGAGSKQFWYDPADSNRVKFAA